MVLLLIFKKICSVCIYIHLTHKSTIYMPLMYLPAGDIYRKLFQLEEHIPFLEKKHYLEKSHNFKHKYLNSFQRGKPTKQYQDT